MITNDEEEIHSSSMLPGTYFDSLRYSKLQGREIHACLPATCHHIVTNGPENITESVFKPCTESGNSSATELFNA
jgi:hypothetical protein